MREFLRRTKMMTGLWALLMIISGVLLVIDPDEILFIVCEIMGFGMLAAGISLVILFFTGGPGDRNFTMFSVVGGIILAALGVFIILNPNTIVKFVTILFALILMMHAIYDIAESRELKFYGDGAWYLPIIAAVIGFILAILIILKPQQIAEIITMFVGISLILSGVSGLVLNGRVIHFGRKFRKREEEKAADIVDGHLISEEDADEEE